MNTTLKVLLRSLNKQDGKQNKDAKNNMVLGKIITLQTQEFAVKLAILTFDTVNRTDIRNILPRPRYIPQYNRYNKRSHHKKQQNT